MRHSPAGLKIWTLVRNFVLVIFALPLLAACGGGGVSGLFAKADINTSTKFSSREYGVSASKREYTGKRVPKGGGRYQVGKPYKVAGRWYKPRENTRYDATGKASWYGPNFHGRRTANGEIFDQNAISAAHPTLPLPSYVRVTNLENGNSIIVRVNDRGPFAHGREIDLSRRAADLLGYINKGTARVRVKYVGRAPLEGDDTRTLMASYNQKTRMERGAETTTRIAFAEPTVRRLAPVPAQQSFATRAVSVHNNVSVTAQGFNIVNSLGSDGLGALFYAPPGFDADDSAQNVHAAIAAATALATRATDLRAWQATMDEDARKLRFELGVFANADNALDVAKAFAVLGAVDEDPVTLKGSAATRLTLSWLKPGVARSDVSELAYQLGLGNVILYD